MTTTLTTYEYATVEVPRRLEAPYRDSYRSFGWDVESETPGLRSVTLELKRDRAMKNRPLLAELQRGSDAALAAIDVLETSPQRVAMAVALSIGVVGSALLALSVFSMQAGLGFASIALGALGLIAWLVAPLSHAAVRTARARRAQPVIARQLEAVYAAQEQAHALR